MKRSWRTILLRLTAASCLLSPLLSGCQNEVRMGGPDIKFLEAQSKANFVVDANNPLLSLKPGNYWDMTAYRQDTSGKTVAITNDRYIVSGPIVINGVQGMDVQIKRKGAFWRREVYRMNGDTLELVAAQDENAPIMFYSPPVPLLKYPAKEGDYQTWIGSFNFSGQKLPARAQSRIASQETIKTPTGIFKTLRIDTMIQIGEGQIKFPSVRWLAPGVGFVRRGYAEQKLPATAEVTRFNVQ